MEKEEKNVKSAMALRRCAKAALVLYGLKSSPKSEDEEMWRREIQDLKIQLLKERFKNKKIKLCGFVEFLLQLLLLLSLCAFFLFFLLKSR